MNTVAIRNYCRNIMTARQFEEWSAVARSLRRRPRRYKNERLEITLNDQASAGYLPFTSAL